MRAPRALAAVALLSWAASAQDGSYAEPPPPPPPPPSAEDEGEQDVQLTPWSPKGASLDAGKGLSEQLGSSVHSLVSKQAAKQASEQQQADASAASADLHYADDFTADSSAKPGELEVFTGPKQARVVGRLPPGLPLASLQVVQHGRLLIVIYHLGGKHTTGIEHHFVLEFEPIKPGVAQYSQTDGSFQYTVKRPTPWGGGRMTTVPIAVEEGDKAKKSDWVAAKSPDGKTYYYNKVTRKTTWTKPPGLAALVGASSSLRSAALAEAPEALPGSLEMKDTDAGTEISGLMPTGLAPQALKVLLQDRQVVVNYHVGGGSGNVGVEQRFVLKFDPLKMSKATYNQGSGAFSFKIEKPPPIKGGAALHIPIKLKQGAPPKPPAKMLLRTGARAKAMQPAA